MLDAGDLRQPGKERLHEVFLLLAAAAPGSTNLLLFLCLLDDGMLIELLDLEALESLLQSAVLTEHELRVACQNELGGEFRMDQADRVLGVGVGMRPGVVGRELLVIR